MSDQHKVLEFHYKNNLPIFIDVQTTWRSRFWLYILAKNLHFWAKLFLRFSGDVRSEKQVYFRLHLVLEEIAEVVDAIRSENLIELTDAIADVLYVVHGLGVTYAVNTQTAFDEVHKSNMTKDFKDPDRRNYKGASWIPPDIHEAFWSGYTKLIDDYEGIRNE